MTYFGVSVINFGMILIAFSLCKFFASRNQKELAFLCSGICVGLTLSLPASWLLIGLE